MLVSLPVWLWVTQPHTSCCFWPGKREGGLAEESLRPPCGGPRTVRLRSPVVAFFRVTIYFHGCTFFSVCARAPGSAGLVRGRLERENLFLSILLTLFYCAKEKLVNCCCSSDISKEKSWQVAVTHTRTHTHAQSDGPGQKSTVVEVTWRRV